MKVNRWSRGLVAAGMALACMTCGNDEFQITRLELRAVGKPGETRSFASGEHILIECWVIGIQLNDNGEYDVQADAVLLAQDKQRPGEWQRVWTAYTFFQENRKAAQGMTSLRIQGDVMPAVEPGSYRMQVTVRDMARMQARESTTEVRLTPPPTPSAEEAAEKAKRAEFNIGAAYQKAYELFQAGDLKGALLGFQAILAVDSKYPEVNYNIGIIQLGLRDPLAARVAFDAELAREPKHFSSLTRVGDLLYGDKKYAEALPYYQRARAVAPKDFFPIFKIGEIYLAQKQYDDAIKSYNDVLQLLPGHEYASINLGSAYYRKGDIDNAMRVFAPLAAKPTSPPIVHLYYAMALYKAKEYALAKVEAYRAKDLGVGVDPGFLASLDNPPS